MFTTNSVPGYALRASRLLLYWFLLSFACLFMFVAYFLFGSHQPEDVSELYPNTVPGYAKALSLVPGAIVCQNHAAEAAFFDLHIAVWQEQFNSKLSRDSVLMNGAPPAIPKAKDYDCHLLAPGTPVRVERGHLVPVVHAVLPDGTTVDGVTLDGMVLLERPRN